MPALITPPLALYVHFPWCVRKCPYCDFNSYTLNGELPLEAYVQRLGRDLAAQAPQVAGRAVTSVFFGGGTPSLFSPHAIGRVLDSHGAISRWRTTSRSRWRRTRAPSSAARFGNTARRA